MQNIAWYLAKKAIGQVGWNQVIIIPQDCFTIQHISNKAQFYCRKAGDDFYFTIFLPDTQNYVYHSMSVDYGQWIFN